jgi:hypothetical protein
VMSSVTNAVVMWSGCELASCAICIFVFNNLCRISAAVWVGPPDLPHGGGGSVGRGGGVYTV